MYPEDGALTRTLRRLCENYIMINFANSIIIYQMLPDCYIKEGRWAGRVARMEEMRSV
jgi:hypothetical protein